MSRPRIAFAREEQTDHRLTRRHLDILPLLAEGLSNPEIAARLGITLGTAKKHVKDVVRRLGAENRANAVLLAMRAGVLS